jgi:DNA helicase II / ATP-dependent DNA helicase PcrA
MKKNNHSVSLPAPLIREEERRFTDVISALHLSSTPREPINYDAELLRLRDALSEEILSDDQAMILDQMNNLSAISEARSRRAMGRADPRNPYFAHLQFREEDKPQPKDVLLGKRAFFHGNIRIVDWRDAPISRLFYRYQEGESFEEDIAGREKSGTITARRIVTIQDGQLKRIYCPQGIFVRNGEHWDVADERGASLSGGAGRAIRPDTVFLGYATDTPSHRMDKHLPEIAALLDRKQFELISSPDIGMALIRGSAGSGKTTVGLHRMAYLFHHDPKLYRPKRMLVLVFNRALARYISRVLPALGVNEVEVMTLAQWAGKIIRRHFRNITPQRCSITPASVIRFKTHRAIIPMLEESARDANCKDPVQVFDDLFTSRPFVEEGIKKHAASSFSSTEIDEIVRWCTNQHFHRVDPTEDDPPMYDEVDDLILLRLQQLLCGSLFHSPGHKLSYDHILVDEAQDFSPLELLVLIHAAKNGSISLAGDMSQKISPTDYSTWEEVLSAIHLDHIQVSPLQVSYRCTREIMEFAQQLVSPLGPVDPSNSVRSGNPVELFRFANAGSAMAFLGDALRVLFDREPTASVAVLCRYPEQADEAYRALKQCDLNLLRRVADQDFSFGPAIEVTDVAQTKGLEFDYVVLLNIDDGSYRDTPSNRHLLHVGATRAIHQLWLLCWQEPSALIPVDIPHRWLG